MSLMVLGTSSHVGKSTMVAAICRILKREGITSAPFKSQNMSLNSYVTKSGGEIGIAQAMQAFAAGLEPEIEMNPILLKPKGDMTSQIVLLGRPYRDVRAGEYYRETDELLKTALTSAETLIRRYGSLVVEGAGGAAEMNLYDRDIANIRLARALRFPIILVGDIERGGIFAQVYGTIALLPEDIRPLVKGIIVNKFRGDPSLFADGMEILRDICHVPILGLVPMTDIAIPSEDSLSIGDKKINESPIRIAVIRLSRISNFTDFELLERYASVRYVIPGEPLTGYDAIIIPGTKNTIEDLDEVIRAGTADAIRNARSMGAVIIGICGGYQMLCSAITDSGIESSAGTYPGIGLIPATTSFGDYEKTTVQVKRISTGYGPILSRISEVEGYEIHMGETDRAGMREAFSGEGIVSDDGLVIGTYMHGLFQNKSAVSGLVGYLAERRGIPAMVEEHKDEDPFDLLADHVAGHVDTGLLLSIFKTGTA